MLRHPWIENSVSLKNLRRLRSNSWHLSNTVRMSSMYLGLYSFSSLRADSYLSLVLVTSSFALETLSCSFFSWSHENTMELESVGKRTEAYLIRRQWCVPWSIPFLIGKTSFIFTRIVIVYFEFVHFSEQFSPWFLCLRTNKLIENKRSYLHLDSPS